MRRSSKVDFIIKKHLGRSNFYCFREHYVVYKLQQDSCHKVHARLIIIYIVCCFIVIFILFFCFLLFVSKLNMRFCHKNFLLPIFSCDHWTLNRKSVTDEIWNRPRACIKVTSLVDVLQKFSSYEYVNSCSSSIVKRGMSSRNLFVCLTLYLFSLGVCKWGICFHHWRRRQFWWTGLDLWYTKSGNYKGGKIWLCCVCD